MVRCNVARRGGVARAVIFVLVAGCSDASERRDAGAEAGPGPDAAAGDAALPTDGAGVDPSALGLLAACPGAAGCLSNAGPLLAGAAAVAVSPTRYEAARVAYLGEEAHCATGMPPAPFGLRRCGALADGAQGSRKDCGLDGVCPGDALTTRVTCAEGTPCPGGLACDTAAQRCILKYPGPDADGSEGDGLPDWFLDCGRDRVCPCQDAAGAPAYFGKDRKCLAGHAPNPSYAAPDADGSEGNGTFEGIWIGGFSTDQPLVGQHDDIWARALVLRSGETTVAVVSVDVVGLFNPVVLKIREAVAAQTAAHEVDYVLVSATHNHAGPDTMGLWGPPMASGVSPELQAEIVAKSAAAVVQAAGALREVTLRVGQARTGAEGLLRDSRDPVIIMDELVALQVQDAQSGETVATLVNWGNHPEALSDTTNLLTSDFPHYLRVALEGALPAAGGQPAQPALGGVAIYLQGAVGCLMTPLRVPVTDRTGAVHERADWDKAEALGVNVALKARAALAQGERLAAPAVAVWAKALELAVDNAVFALAYRAKIIDWTPPAPGADLTAHSEIAVVRVGPLTLFTLPGEIAPELLVGGYDGSRSFGAPIIAPDNENPPDLAQAPPGPYLMERVPGAYKIPVGLGNDELGYIVPQWNFVLGDPPYLEQAAGDHYEETNSLGPQTFGTIARGYEALLEHVGE